MKRDVIDFLLGLNSWQLSAIVGAIAGAIGGLIGGFVARYTRFQQAPLVLTVIAVVGSVSLSRQVVVPAIINVSMNAELPKQVDEITTMTKINYSGRRYVYDFQLADSVPDVEAADIKAALGAQLCSHWQPLFAAGEVLSAEYRYQLRGQQISFIVEPRDCP